MRNVCGIDLTVGSGRCCYAICHNMQNIATGRNCTSKQLLKWNLRVVVVVAENAKIVEIIKRVEEDIMKSRFTVGAFYCSHNLNSQTDAIGRD